MGAPQPTPHLGIDDYLAWEAGQPERHEYLQGEVYAMTGARDAHNTIAGNLFVLLREGLRGGPCRVYIADMKLRLDAAEAVFYPDLMVTCDPRDRTAEADTCKRHPKLLVEVLSESTAAYDRGRKFELYRSIDTIEEVPAGGAGPAACGPLPPRDRGSLGAGIPWPRRRDPACQPGPGPPAGQGLRGCADRPDLMPGVRPGTLGHGWKGSGRSKTRPALPTRYDPIPSPLAIGLWKRHVLH